MQVLIIVCHTALVIEIVLERFVVCLGRIRQLRHRVPLFLARLRFPRLGFGTQVDIIACLTEMVCTRMLGMTGRTHSAHASLVSLDNTVCQ